MADMPAAPVRKLVSMSPGLAREIQTWRFAMKVNTESEAIRLLIRAGLAALPPDIPKPPRKKRTPKSPTG
jgi:hypothetical protein